MKGKELYLLEITPRFHGDIYSLHLYGNIYDKSIIEHYFNYVINKTVPRIINNNNYSGYLPIYARPGHVLRVTGLSDAHSSRGVEKIILLKENNFTIKENTNNSSVLGFIIGIGNSYDKLTENLNNSRRKIGFDYAPQR